jgi:hypothetical protein
LQAVCPVSVGEFFSPMPVTVTPDDEVTDDEELEDVEDVEDVEEDAPDVVVDEPVSRMLSPGDCPGVMNVDCGVLVR